MPSYVRAGIRKCARIRALSKQTVNMPVVEVKFDNDDNEVRGDTLLGNCPSRSKPTAQDHGTSNWTRRN